VQALRARLATLRRAGPDVSGKCLDGVPNHLRGATLAQLHVLCRLRGEAPTLHEAGALRAFLADGCGGLLGRLDAEWYEEKEGGKRELRAEYAPPARGAPKARKK